MFSVIGKIFVGIIGLVVVLAIIGVATAGTSTDTTASSPPTMRNDSAPPAAGPMLALETGWACNRSSSSYFKLEGQVTNTTDKPIRNVTAVAIYSKADGSFVTSDTALIEYNPLLAGQTSPFSVLTQYNPAMEKCRVEFKDLLGGSISFTAK